MATKKTKASTVNKEVLTEMVTCTLSVYRKLTEEAAKLPSLIIDVTSREGNVKPDIHPVVAAINSTAETLRRQLSESMVPPKSKASKGRGGADDEENDPLAKLISKVEQLNDD